MTGVPLPSCTAVALGVDEPDEHFELAAVGAAFRKISVDGLTQPLDRALAVLVRLEINLVETGEQIAANARFRIQHQDQQ